MKFSDLTECPFCGNDEFYTKDYIQGPSWYFRRFDGKEADNTEMYDCTNHIQGKRAYCAKCNEYLGNIETDVLAKSALRRKEKDS